MRDNQNLATAHGGLPPLPPPPAAALHPLQRQAASASVSSAALPFSDKPKSSGSRATPPTPPFSRSSQPLLDLEDHQPLTGKRLSRRDSVLGVQDDGRDAWEDEGKVVEEPHVNDRKSGHLVVLSKHPTFVLDEVKAHAGVLVAIRRRKGDHGALGDEDVALERMPLTTRIGMRLLYHGLTQGRIVRSKVVENTFKKWSEKEGKKFDNPRHALERIQHFVDAYDIKTDDLLKPNLADYPTLNHFFYRKLRPDARPIASPDDATVISSAADCRLTVFDSVDSAKKLWVKGHHFTLETLLRDASLASDLKNGSVAIFRLAPADYHRFHTPIACVVGETKHIPGVYYTVNSMIVRDKRFDVFTENKRDVTTLHTINPAIPDPSRRKQIPVAYVQVGALLVASIRQTKKEGKAVKRGDELGYFAYGGSTVIAVFPARTVKWDADLLRNSKGENAEGVQVETLVKVGEKIGKWVAP